MATIVRDVRPWGGPSADIVVEDGVVRELTVPGAHPSADTEIAGGGRLAVPAFSDVHVHLDSTRIGLPFRPHSALPGPLWNQIANDRAHWRDAEANVADRATETLGRAIGHGMTRARSYAQVDADCRLERLEGVLAAREAHSARASVQVVAFPQAGLLLEPGVPELIDEAMRSGADVVGGIDPCALDKDPARHLGIVFELAERHHAPIDIHLHEPGELGRWTIAQILERVRALDMRGRVTLAHAFSLGDAPLAAVAPMLDEIAELDVSVTTIAPGGRHALPVLAMQERGIRLGLGQDGQRDYWSPYGNTDMLDRTWQLSFTQNLRRDADIEAMLLAATIGGATVIDPAAGAVISPSRGFAAGAPADLVLVPGQTPTSAVMDRSAGRTTIHEGRVIADDGELL